MSLRPSVSATTITATLPSNKEEVAVSPTESGRPRLLTAAETEAEIEERTRHVDEVVSRAFTGALASEFPTGMAALAVGGFGRRELFPFSDVDVLLLIADDKDPSSLKQSIGVFVQQLWDAGLRLSHSVRTLDDCCQLHDGNTELSISLIDRRLLTGDAQLFAELESRIPKFFKLHGRTLGRHLSRLTRARHNKFQNTIYHLEPNLKETPGGMRDVHVTHWLSRLLETDPPELSGARGFLFPLRHFLHLRSHRDDNILSFEAQDLISAQPSEMMRNYYRHARLIERAATDLVERSEQAERSLLGQFRDWRSRLSNSDFTVARERVLVRSPQQLTRDPSLLMRLFAFCARHEIALAPDTEQRIPSTLPALVAAPPPEMWLQFREILNQPHAATGLRAMEQTGALVAILPEWTRIDCLVVRDFYHRYTVDEHTIVAIESLEHVEDGRFHDLLTEIDQPWLLRFALLLHDIGKGGGHHVAEGLALAKVICRRFELTVQETETVLFLIQQHLLLSGVMNSRDLDDVDTARAVARQVGTVERLKMLTLLTHADISAVNPTALTPWRREQLWRAYLLAYEELTRELDTERISGPQSARPDLAEFLDGFPTRYLRTHTEAEMERHRDLWRTAQSAGVAVDIQRHSGFYRLAVAAADRPFLFASISGALAAFGMNILKAEAFANTTHVALDTFTFADPIRTLELNPSEVDRLHDTVLRVASGKEDVRRLLHNRARPAKRPQRVKPSVTFNNVASPAATLIEIVAEDRPGLLYDLTSAMSQAGCNIEVVLIDTEAQKALDVFYVTAAGGKLDASHDPLKASLLEICSA